MAFTIRGIVRDKAKCRIPRHFLTAVDVATSRVLATTEVKEGNSVPFTLKYDRAKLNLRNEPHEVLLVGTKDPFRGKTGEATGRIGAGVGIEDRIAADTWVKDGSNFTVPERIIAVDCCCILWALFGIYSVTGTLLHDPTGLPLPGATVTAQDWDPLIPDNLGSDVTDADGRFRIQVPYANFTNEDGPINRPDLRFRVTVPDSSGKPCECLGFAEDPIRFNWPNCRPIILKVPCCLSIIERVGGWAAHLDPVPASPSPHAPPPPNGRGIDSTAARAQGLNADGTPGQIAEDSVFGGRVTLCGATTCKNAEKYRFMVAPWADEATAPSMANFIPITTPFSEMVYSGFNCFPFPPFGNICIPSKASVNQASPLPTDPDAGFFDILPNTESGCLIAHWNTNTPPFPDGKYSILLTIRDAQGCEFNSSPVTIRLDNTHPNVELDVSVPDCATITIGDVVTGTLTVTDTNFHGYQLRYEGDGVSGVLAQRIYTGVGDTGDTNISWTWNTAGLPPCGYRLVLRAWDRAIVNNVRSQGEPGFGHLTSVVKYYCLGTKVATGQ